MDKPGNWLLPFVPKIDLDEQGFSKAQSLKGGSVPGRLSQLCAFT